MADETVSWISLVGFDIFVRDDANKGPGIEFLFPDDSGVLVDNETELRPCAAIRLYDHWTVVIMAAEGCTGQNKKTCISAGQICLSHAMNTIADEQ